MDGFRDRMSGRIERNQQMTASSSYQTADTHTFERPVKTVTPAPVQVTAPAGPSIEEINEAINKSNQEQINVLAEYFDEAKADRMASERAIIEELTNRMGDIVSSYANSTGKEDMAGEEVNNSVIEETSDEENVQPQEEMVENQQPPVDPELFMRLERIAGQNGEEISENGEMLRRCMDYLRAHTELINEIKSEVDSVREAQNNAEYAAANIQMPVASPVMPDISVDFTQEKEEILGALGDNRAILNMLRQDVLSGFAKPDKEDTEEEEKPEIELLSKEIAENHFRSLEDLVHSECVKVFKNMKKSIEEDEKTLTDTQKSVSGLKLFGLGSIILNAITLLLLALHVFQIF